MSGLSITRSPRPNLCHRVRNDNTLKIFAIFKSIINNHRCSFGDDAHSVFDFKFCHRSILRLPIHREAFIFDNFMIYKVDSEDFAIPRHLQEVLDIDEFYFSGFISLKICDRTSDFYKKFGNTVTNLVHL